MVVKSQPYLQTTFRTNTLKKKKSDYERTHQCLIRILISLVGTRNRSSRRGGDTLCGWDEWKHQGCLQEVQHQSSPGRLSAQYWPRSRIHYFLVSSCIISPAAAARSILGRPDRDWRWDSKQGRIQVYCALSACSYCDTVHISIWITASCLANIKHSNLQLPETVLWKRLTYKGWFWREGAPRNDHISMNRLNYSPVAINFCLVMLVSHGLRSTSSQGACPQVLGPPRLLCIVRAQKKVHMLCVPHRHTNPILCVPPFFNLWICPCKEHQYACGRGMKEKLAVAEHAWENHHSIQWEETTVLDHDRGQELLALDSWWNWVGKKQM